MNSSDHQLHRHIGLLSLILFGVGDILGAGIYGLIGRAAGELGHAVWLAFLLSALAAGLTGLSYATLGSRYPKAAGAAFVIERAFGRPALAYVAGLAIVASGLTSMATAARVFAGYLTGWVPAMPPTLVIVLLASGMALLLFWGMRESLWFNAVCTVIEVLGLLLVIAVGFSYIGKADFLDASTPQNPMGELSAGLLLTGAVLTFYSFVGFEDILNVAEEVKDPRRNLPRGLIWAVGISSGIYILVSLVAVSVVPPHLLATSPQPLVDVVKVAAPWFPTQLYSSVAMFAVANTMLLNFIMGSRLVYGMARQNLLPSVLGRVHSQRHTPHLAIAVIYVILLILALSGDISQLARATSVLLLLTFTLMNSSLILLKRRPAEVSGHFEAPLWVPIGGVVVCLALLAHSKSSDWQVAGALLGGIGVLYLLQHPTRRTLERFFREP